VVAVVVRANNNPFFKIKMLHEIFVEHFYFGAFSCHAKDVIHQLLLRLRSQAHPTLFNRLPNDERSAILRDPNAMEPTYYMLCHHIRRKYADWAL
jgi:hypothetical protein